MRSAHPRRILAALAVAVTGALVAGCTPSPPNPRLPHPVATRGSASGSGPSSGPGGGLEITGPVVPPTTGALIGAWVKPDGALTQASRLNAVSTLESWLGRPLDIVNTYRRFSEPFPTSSDKALAKAGSTLMVSWATGDNRAISSGSLDPQITAWAQRFKAFHHPILLRMRWEMDRPNLATQMYSGPDFVAAWKHVRAIFTAQHVRNVSWVWCPTITGFANGSAPSFYPGDSMVDWTCVDVYSSAKLQPLSQLLQPFLTWAAAHPKPIMIGEFGVAGAYDSASRAAWLASAAIEFRDNPQIKAVCYFDSDPDGALPTQSFSLPPGSTELAALASMARAPYFNPRGLRIVP
jgi:hypothetical protein